MSIIMVTFPLCRQNEKTLLDDTVVYRPDLPTKNARCWTRAVVACGPAIIITRHEHLDKLAPAMVQLRPCIIVIIERAGCHETERVVLPGKHQIVHSEGESDLQAERDAFVQAEALHTQNLPLELPSPPLVLPSRREITLIGAGIVNLITGVELLRRGYRLAIYDQGPPPECDERDWRNLGATFGGGDGRIYSFNESRHHHAGGPEYGEDSNTQFRRGIANRGWSSRPPSEFSPSDEAWVGAFERVPPWLRCCYDVDIIRFNKDGHAWWSTLEREQPELFDRVGFHNGLYRVYQMHRKYESARQREMALGTVLEEITLERVAHELPSLAQAVRSGQVAGVLKVRGFSVNIHAFARTLIRFLERNGVPFFWRKRLTRVFQDQHGRVTAVELGGVRIETGNYVVSLGASGVQIVGLEALQSQLGAVMGVWLTLPNGEPQLNVALKVSRRDFACDGAAEGANIIPGIGREGSPVLHCSAGHGFLGMDPHLVDNAIADELARCVRETAAGLFPDKYRLAVAAGAVEQAPRYCVRPWTSSGLGLFCIRPTKQNGIFVFTGGHNTGGFSQAPAVAEAVVAALGGVEHSMHRLYHPDRCRSFVQASCI